MTLEEVYNYCDRNWSEFTRRFGYSMGGVRLWRQKNGLPMKTQRRIQDLTNGELVADIRHIGDNVR